MDAEAEADRMIGTINNIISELMTARNKVQKHRDILRRRGVDEDDVRRAKSELRSLSFSIEQTYEGLRSVTEPVDE